MKHCANCGFTSLCQDTVQHFFFVYVIMCAVITRPQHKLCDTLCLFHVYNYCGIRKIRHFHVLANQHGQKCECPPARGFRVSRDQHIHYKLVAYLLEAGGLIDDSEGKNTSSSHLDTNFLVCDLFSCSQDYRGSLAYQDTLQLQGASTHNLILL